MDKKLLLVEDDIQIAAQIGEVLRNYFGASNVDHVPSLTAALEMDVLNYDLVLTDLNLQDGSGLDVLKEFLIRRSDLPIVMITSDCTIENASASIEGGAYDYIVKSGDYLTGLPIMVEKNLAIWRTKQENARLHVELQRTIDSVRDKNAQLHDLVEQLELVAQTDPLTGLANRRAFNDSLERCFSESVRYKHDLSCVMIDLDGFKQLNDSLGHQAGDAMLQLTAKVLVATSRRYDVAARLGGDEFTLLLPQTDELTATQVANRIAAEFDRAVAEKLNAMNSSSLNLSMSLGLASRIRCNLESPQQLIGCADKALYEAKVAGKKQLKTYGDLSCDIDNRV